MVKLTLQQKLQRYSKLYKWLEVCGNKLLCLQKMSNNLIFKTLIASQKLKFFILFNISLTIIARFMLLY